MNHRVDTRGERQSNRWITSLLGLATWAMLAGTAGLAFAEGHEDGLWRCGHLRSDMRCVSVPLADATDDKRAHLFEAKPDLATVYLVRAQIVGSRTRIPIFLDDKELGKTAPRTYAYIQVPPGKHLLQDYSDTRHTLALDVKAGELYFVSEEVTVVESVVHNQKVQTELVLVDHETGKSKVNRSRMIRL